MFAAMIYTVLFVMAALLWVLHVTHLMMVYAGLDKFRNPYVHRVLARTALFMLVVHLGIAADMVPTNTSAPVSALCFVLSVLALALGPKHKGAV